MSLRQIIGDMQDALRQRKAQGTVSSEFQKKRQEGLQMQLQGAMKRLVEATRGNDLLAALAHEFVNAKESEQGKILEKIAEHAGEERQERVMSVHFIPLDVRDVIETDLREVQSCMNAQCYRSAMILCGRVLETALHRKYFDATGQDLLEKAPGMGLGNLIAKLAEKGVQLDPGLGNQIHLINQVRVFSVHTKQQSFTPSKMQAEAIVLYTLDILEKLFR